MFNKNVRLWLYGALLIIGSILLFLGGPDYFSSRSFKHFWDIGHIVYFAPARGGEQATMCLHPATLAVVTVMIALAMWL